MRRYEDREVKNEIDICGECADELMATIIEHPQEVRQFLKEITQ